MDIVVKRISTKNEERLLINAVKFLKDYYKTEIGETMDFKLTLLSDPKVEKFLVQNVSDDPHCYLCLLLYVGKSYGFWLVDECFENIALEISISSQIDSLEIIETEGSNFKQFVRNAL